MGHEWPTHPFGEQGRMATLTGVYALRYPAPAFQGRDSPH